MKQDQCLDNGVKILQVTNLKIKNKKNKNDYLQIKLSNNEINE